MVLPQVDELDQFWHAKEAGTAYAQPAKYADIHMPRNTGVGVFMGAFGTVPGFALVWHIWWLAAAGLVGMVGSFIARAYDRDTDYWVSAAEVERIERERMRSLRKLIDQGAAPAEQKVA